MPKKPNKKPPRTRDPRKDLSNYEPILLSSVDLVDWYWDATKPLIQRCIDKAMHGEMTVDDIKRSILEGTAYAMVLKSDKFEAPDVKFVLVLELINYPQYSAFNVVILGGTNLRMLLKRYWSFVCGWAYMMGIRYFECSVSPAMERIVQRIGFNRTYIRMQLKLEVPNE